MELWEKKLRHELVVNLDGGNAHMSFEEVVADFPLQYINAKERNIPYSPWAFLEHMRIAQSDILQFIINPRHVSPHWPQGYRPAPDVLANEEMWNTTISLYKKDLSRLQEMATDSSVDLFGPIPHAPDYTIFKEIMTASIHNSYHIGEVALLRQTLRIWPKERPYLTGEITNEE